MKGAFQKIMTNLLKKDIIIKNSMKNWKWKTLNKPELFCLLLLLTQSINLNRVLQKKIILLDIFLL